MTLRPWTTAWTRPWASCWAASPESRKEALFVGDDDRLPALFDAGAQGVVVGDLEADPHREGDLAALGDGGDCQRAGAVAGQHVDADAVDLGGQASHEGTGGNVLGEGYGPVLAVVGMNRLPGDVSGFHTRMSL